MKIWGQTVDEIYYQHMVAWNRRAINIPKLMEKSEQRVAKVAE